MPIQNDLTEERTGGSLQPVCSVSRRTVTNIQQLRDFIRPFTDKCPLTFEDDRLCYIAYKVDADCNGKVFVGPEGKAPETGAASADCAPVSLLAAPVRLLAAPVRRHPDCAETDCQTCLDDHHHLGLYIGLKCGGSLLMDWLAEYRKWLDNQGIPTEVNGWASRQAFDKKNVLAFVKDWCSL